MSYSLLGNNTISMKILQTAERVSHEDPSDNYVLQRSIFAYREAAQRVSGNVLEIGTGSGYGIEIISPQVDKFVTVDKFKSDILSTFKPGQVDNVEFVQMNVPPFKGIPDNSFDFVITFQVIEHIVPHEEYVKEINRVLKPGGKAIITTPNIKMSLTRNPWHIREYTVKELKDMLLKYYSSVETKGVYGNEKVMNYYEENKKSVEKITRFDIFNLQYLLPRQLLQIPYDVLNRMNRKRLLDNKDAKVNSITVEDYFLSEAKEDCLDLFYIATK